MDKEFFVPYISKQSQTESEASITEHPYVSNMLDNYQTYANFVEILFAYKSKYITIYYAKKNPQNCSIKKKNLWCILNS